MSLALDIEKDIDQSSVEVLNSKELVLNFSIDSGMEEPGLPQSQSASDSEDEVVCKRKVKKKAILDDDSDNEEINEDMYEAAHSPSNEDKENIPMPEENDGGESDDDNLKLNLEMETEQGEESDGKGSDDNEDKISEDSPGKSSTLRMDFKNSDIFDAESDDEQTPLNPADEDAGNDSTHENDGDGDEGFDESQLDPALLAKLKKMKGASKTPKEKEKLKRKAKPTAEQMTELYSESQRMLRDSRVNLPYYEPETKSLDDFLARASKKRQEYSVLSKPKDFQKALIIQEKLSVKPPKQSPVQKDTAPKLSLKSKSATQESPSIPDSIPAVASHDSGMESQELGMSQASTVILAESTTASSNVHQCVDGVDDEELPDINPVLPQNDSLPHSDGSTKQQKDDKDHAGGSQQRNILVDESCSKEAEISLQKDPSRDLFSSLTSEEQREERLFGQILQDVEGHDLCIEKDSDCKDNVDNHVLTCESAQIHENHESVNEPDIKSVENEIDESVGAVNSEKETMDTGNGMLRTEITSNTSPNSKSHKLKLLQKLEQHGLVVPELPKLSGSPDVVIDLDNEAPEKTQKDSGVLKLMDRLIQHQTKKKPHASYDVNLSIIEKEAAEGGQKELKLKSMTYHVEEEKEELPSSTPGAKLTILKEKLGAGMKIKREEARLRRQLMFNLENEEGFEGSKSDEEQEEEEAEMTDGETSSEEEDEEALLGMMDDGSDGEDYNPLLDTEAREDDEEEEEDIFGMDENSNDVKLRFEVSDEDDNDDSDSDGKDDDTEDHDIPALKDDDESTLVKGKKKSHHRILSDDEDSKPEMATVKDGYQSDAESLPEIELTPLTRHFQDTQYHRESSRSPELYGPSQFEESSNSTRPGDNLNDSGSNFHPHSQMLDADGYLKTTQNHRPPKSGISLLVEAPDTEDNAIMDGFDSSSKMTAGKIFGGMSGRIDSQADNMSELLGLCSGNFQQNSLSGDAINPSQNRRYDQDEDELSNPFRIVHTGEEEEDSTKTTQRKRIKPMLSDSEDEREAREADTDIEDDDDDESKMGKFFGFKDKVTKGIRREFLEDEAELSGSEYDSDENLDLAEEDDILEEEAGDRDMAGVSEEELRNQVGKVHMKQLLDDDDRAVMRFKEMYLQDGDLHSDGNGRMRHFRWKDAGDASQQDLFQHQSDEEHVEEDAEEMKWRKERIEREKFLEESQQGDGEPNKELQKYGQMFVKRSDSVTSLQRGPITQLKPTVTQQPSIKKKGSFLSRGKAALVQFASIAKTALGGNSKQKSHSFVFQSKDNQDEENVEKEEMPQPMQPPKRKAHSVPNAGASQAAKKPRLSSNSKQTVPPVKRGGSIFNLLDP